MVKKVIPEVKKSLETSQKFMKQMLDKGIATREESKKRFEDWSGKITPSELMEKIHQVDIYKYALVLREELEQRVEGGTGRLLDILGIASREDVDELSQKLDTLTAKVQKLAKPAQKRVVKKPVAKKTPRKNNTTKAASK